MILPDGWVKVSDYCIECSTHTIAKVLCQGIAAYAVFRKPLPGRGWRAQPESATRISDWLASPEAALEAAQADQTYRAAV